MQSIARLKARVYGALRKKNFRAAFMPMLDEHGPAKLLKPLFSAICHSDEALHWHAVTCMGETVRRIADADMEDARVVMRRFMWSLNDESGGIGWGVPEAMAECLALHHGLAAEYTHILVSFMREDGFFLEYEPLQAGLMWGIYRLAAVEPELLMEKNAAAYQEPYLGSSLPAVRGLAAASLGRLGAAQAAEGIGALTGDKAGLRLYERERLLTVTVGELARRALAALGG